MVACGKMRGVMAAQAKTTRVLTVLGALLCGALPAQGRPKDTPSARARTKPMVPTAGPAGAGCRGERAGMACIPGGWFTMGSNDGEDDEKPPRRRLVRTFYMDRTEVTVAAYRGCVRAGKCKDQRTTNYGTIRGKGDAFWSQRCNLGKDGRDEHPMNCVDWEQAAAYCASVHKRLPTEKEWEYAARGAAGRTYPWGDRPEPGPTLLNACGEECVAWARENELPWPQMYQGSDGWAHTAPVGQYPAGRTPEGLLDMAGNVWEWVQDAYAPCAESLSCKTEQGSRVVRGACWSSDVPRYARAANRDRNAAGDRDGRVGFRCAQDL